VLHDALLAARVLTPHMRETPARTPQDDLAAYSGVTPPSQGWCGEASPATARINCTAGTFGLANSGYMYLTWHAIAAEFASPESRLTGRITVTTTPPTLPYIKPAQLHALRDIYNTMCKPTQDQLPIWNVN